MTATRRLAAILAADVVGYSRLMGEDEAGTALSVREHRDAARPIVAAHGGRIVKTTGDGLLLEFVSEASAVQLSALVVSSPLGHRERQFDVRPETLAAERLADFRSRSRGHAGVCSPDLGPNCLRASLLGAFLGMSPLRADITSGRLLDPDEARRRLESRLGPLHARLRLGIEREHEAQAFGQGLSFLHLENLPLMQATIEIALRLTGTYGRGRANAGKVQLRRNCQTCQAPSMASQSCILAICTRT
jgi:hypothetical protein